MHLPPVPVQVALSGPFGRLKASWKHSNQPKAVSIPLPLPCNQLQWAHTRRQLAYNSSNLVTGSRGERERERERERENRTGGSSWSVKVPQERKPRSCMYGPAHLWHTPTLCLCLFSCHPIPHVNVDAFKALGYA